MAAAVCCAALGGLLTAGFGLTAFAGEQAVENNGAGQNQTDTQQSDTPQSDTKQSDTKQSDPKQSDTQQQAGNKAGHTEQEQNQPGQQDSVPRKATDGFVPSEEISEDLSVSFPVDI